MYTANTMASAIEALGMSLPYSSSIPAEDPLKQDECRLAGRYVLELLKKDLKPRDIMTRAAFENAMVTVMATGGSTNAVLHLIAMARAAGVPLSLDDFQRVSDRTPFLADLTVCVCIVLCVCVRAWVRGCANVETMTSALDAARRRTTQTLIPPAAPARTHPPLAPLTLPLSPSPPSFSQPSGKYVMEDVHKVRAPRAAAALRAACPCVPVRVCATCAARPKRLRTHRTPDHALPLPLTRTHTKHRPNTPHNTPQQQQPPNRSAARRAC